MKKKEETYNQEMKRVLEDLYEHKEKATTLKEIEKEENQLRELVTSKIAGY